MTGKERFDTLVWYIFILGLTMWVINTWPEPLIFIFGK